MNDSRYHKRPPPAFQLYASDLLADENFRLASLAQRGLLLTMLCECWVNRAVPKDPKVLAKLLGLDEAETRAALADGILKTFAASEDRPGYVECPDLVRQQRERSEQRAAQSAGGRKGAEERWRQPKPPPDGYPNGVPNGSRVGSEESRKEPEQKGSASKIDDEFVQAYEAESKKEAPIKTR
jgi:hypothetical protein